MSTSPHLGARIAHGWVAFRVWAPRADTVEVFLENQPPDCSPLQPLTRSPNGYFHSVLPVQSGDMRYRYRVNHGNFFPDPASRFQPAGVHGPSQVVDLARFPWTDAAWPGPARDDLSIYELHVGTFSPEGTFDGVTRRLPLLRDLGVTAIELMPVGDFAGQRNWGYDGVAPFAPARCYGTPLDLQHLVDTAHGLGLAVILDVVYNHFGPDGNYTGVFSPYYVSTTHQTPWGTCLNFDGPESEPVREFFIQNALHWLGEYHFDGLRLDATHAIVDDGPRHFLAELADRMHREFPNRRIVLIAEDHRNLAHMLRPTAERGWGLDAVWADDFHHAMRRLLAGDHEGYYRDYRGESEELAAALNDGWLYTGQHSTHLGEPRGTDPAGLAPERFVFALQNHDQVGNRALGERLNHQIDLATYRAASAVLLLAPQTPLLFMGQEWAASSPFLYFTDHNPELGRLIAEGRRSEFGHFSAFADPKHRERIPDPQAETTFGQSKLNWDERDRDPHRGTLALYRALLALRRGEPALRAATRATFDATTWDADTLVMRWGGNDGSRLMLVARLCGAGTFRAADRPDFGPGAWRVLLHTEESRFSTDSRPPTCQLGVPGGPEIEFMRPGAVLLHS
jgi:maltooligosyltrehalose trehalohydrolase